jgi:hypothetical protein
MKSDPILFADLERLLNTIGFEKLAQPDYSIFQHPSTKAMISLPKYQATEVIEPIHLSLVRRILDTYNLMTPAAFDGLAEKIAP